MRELLSAYIDGWLSGRERRMIEDHLARCAACREDLDGLRATVDLLRRVAAVKPSRELTMVAPPRPSLGPVPWPLPAASMAAGLLLALVVAADAAGALPQGEPLAVPSAPAQSGGAATERMPAPSGGIAVPPAPAPVAQTPPASMDTFAAPTVIEAPAVPTKSEQPPTPVRGPEDAADRLKTPWRLVEAGLGVITLALITLWARKAMRGARP